LSQGLKALMTNLNDVVFLREKVCPYCKDGFKAHYRSKNRQKTCGKLDCKKHHRKNYQRNYRILNKDSEIEYQTKRKSKLSKDYWKVWRLKNPNYVLKNRARSKLIKRLLKNGLQRKLDIVQVAESNVIFPLFCEFATRHRCLILESVGKYL
jgi:hypothetical protein